ncbi:DUF7112 family protein [Halobacterium zhouii]|uniref:DUF7112 family protein n=1 Tax=Halobacterium zhouii TaxID=2902624 RepID=UPI001E374F74|nr:hypothetical protein [Halobacterium zhouii]
MAEFVSSETVPSVVGTLVRRGGTQRPAIALPAESTDRFPSDDVVRLVLDGSEHRTRLVHDADGAPAIRGAYETNELARSPGDGENALPEWVDAHGLDIGRSVHVDVVVPEFKYGVRAPGETTTYEATEPPKSSLADIAESIDGK